MGGMRVYLSPILSVLGAHCLVDPDQSQIFLPEMTADMNIGS